MAKKYVTGKWIFWGIFTAIVLGAIFITLRPDPVWVDLATVTRGSMEVSITEEGETRVIDRYLISSPVSGYLHRVTLEVGDSVTPGQILTEVDPLPAAVLDARSRAEAEVRVEAALSALNSARQKAAAAEAEATFAANELTRLQALRSNHFVSEDRLQQAEAANDRARAILRSARFDEEVMAHELRAARTRLEVSAATSSDQEAIERIEIKSPVNGAVLKVEHKSEGVIQAGEAILEVGDPGALEVVVDVQSFDAVKLAPGVLVRLKGWGGEPLEAAVKRVEPVGFEDISALGVEEQRVQVVADISSPQHQWKNLGDRYRVDATFILWSADDVLQIPASSIFMEGGRSAVFRAVDGRAEQIVIETGISNGLQTIVTNGLDVGDQIIRHPDRQLEDGSRIRVR